LAVPVLLAAAAIIALTAWRIGAAGDEGTFALKDVAGDRAALHGVTIAGELTDGYHRTVFTIEDGRVAHRTAVLDPPASPDIGQPFRPGARRMFDGIAYEARPALIGWMDFDVRYMDWREPKRYRSGTARVKTGLVYRQPQSGQYRFANDLNYGIAKIGEKVYFTVPTTRDFSGTNGIYAIDEFPGRHDPFDDEAAARTLAEIDLERNRELPEGAAGLEVLGLEAAGDRLALLLADEGRLAVRAYDSLDGTPLGELVLEDTIVSTDPSVELPGEVHSGSYQAYADHDTGVLNLLLYRTPEGPELVSVTMLSFDLTDGVRLVAAVKESFERERAERDIYGVTKLGYRDGRLIAVKTLQETEEESGIIYAALQPRHLMIFVYENGKPVYQGELVTDANDDLHRIVNADNRGFGYDVWDYRHFNNITISGSGSGG
jgi:hypothetical protein